MKKIHCCLVVVAIALLSCQTGLANESLTAQDWLQRGMELEKQNLYEGAINMYTAAIAADKNYSEAYFKRAKAYMASHRTNAMAALPDFDRSIDLDPGNAEAYYERGLLHAFVINNEHARDDMRTAANLGHKGAQKWLARSPESKGKVKQQEGASTGATAAIGSAETSMAEAPNSPAAGLEGSKEPEGAPLGLGQYLPPGNEPMIHFDFNSSAIKEEYHAILDKIALVLKETIPAAGILLAGYTDSTGTETYNDALSLRRAKAVESYLTEKHGLSPDRLSVRGYGESAPIAPNETAEGQARNRRVELLIAGK